MLFIFFAFRNMPECDPNGLPYYLLLTVNVGVLFRSVGVLFGENGQ